MSVAYDNYLKEHKANVGKGLEWLHEHLPNTLADVTDWQIDRIATNHDKPKCTGDEYHAYDAYFYGKNKSYEVVNNFKYAWLYHIHDNPHHWQYWVLINDDPKEGTVALDIPYNFIIEMICDWWSFSWKSGELYEIFSWYDQHKDHMILSRKTRFIVEDILGQIREKLDELNFKKE